MATGSNEAKTAAAPATANTLTIRLLMAGKEVGSIIGKKGEIIKKFRDESGSRINISDGSCPERIVTITGTKDSIYKAFTLICNKFEEDLQTLGTNVPKPPITLRLIVPASQCGSLIGKGGSKIKELREISGASVQVASEMLPNSNERAVTVSGVGEAIPQCIYQICKIMLETPPKGATIPYRPKPQLGGPMIVAGGQAYTIQGNYAVPATPDITKLAGSPLASLAALGLGGIGGAAGLNPAASVAALAALAGTQLRGVNGNNSQTSHEMTVPNELIGCIIGKGGTKIAEIRQVSGAMIRISNCEDREGVTPTTERTVTITGSPESVALAQYLINTSVEVQKSCADGEVSETVAAEAAARALSSAQPLAQLFAKPGALSSLSGLPGVAAVGSLNELLRSLQQNTVSCSVGRDRFQGHVRSVSPTIKQGRKFAPY